MLLPEKMLRGGSSGEGNVLLVVFKSLWGCGRVSWYAVSNVSFPFVLADSRRFDDGVFRSSRPPEIVGSSFVDGLDPPFPRAFGSGWHLV